MLQFVIFLVIAYFGYRWLGWTGVGGAGVLYLFYLLLVSMSRSAREHSTRVKAALLVGTPLSDAEKAHLDVMKERDQRMAERQATKNRYH